MNEFEKRINELRIQFKTERVQITRDAYRHIGHINNALSQSPFPEVRDALRAEKERVYEAMRNSHKYNRICYLQQLELLQDEYQRHLNTTGSKKQLRRIMQGLCRAAAAQGQTSVSISFGNNQNATITFG